MVNYNDIALIDQQGYLPHIPRSGPLNRFITIIATALEKLAVAMNLTRNAELNSYTEAPLCVKSCQASANP